VAQVGAVIGSEFSYELLHAVHPLAEADLQGALRRLADAELIYVHGIPPDADYTFKHALVRDAAYEALLKSRRRGLHHRVALTITEKFSAMAEAQPEVLARHWTEAGEVEPAIAEWSRAGKAAEARHAFREALESYHQALALLNLLSDSPERDNRELELRLSALKMLQVTRWAAPETIDAIERFAALAEKSGNLTQLFGVVSRRVVIANTSGDLHTGGVLADQVLDLAVREGSPTSLAVAHCQQMINRFWRGDLAGAEKHYTAGLRFFFEPGFGRLFPGGALWTFGQASYNAWMLGRADVARERMAEMIAAANAHDSHDLAISGICAAALRSYLREYEQVETLALRTLDLSEKNQFLYIAAYSRCALGQARAQLGRAIEGVVLIREGIAGLLECGIRTGIPHYATSLAEAQQREGAIVDALATVEQALQANPDELAHRPETLRLRGELWLKQEQTELAEAGFREAIALAQKMSAKGWELRATMSLTRLLNEQGHRHEARAMLAEIYGWFTEGFDTADLKNAKALLDELEA
jgi:tetratricopeptide (TPR) repeat protein